MENNQQFEKTVSVLISVCAIAVAAALWFNHMGA